MEHSPSKCPVVLQTGFRIFFLGAAVYAVISMLVWLAFYIARANIFVAMPLTVWHGHEMIFGYTMAVIAGFLLTAVMNWTGLPTVSGYPLLGIFILWMTARIWAFLPDHFPLWPMVVCDGGFILFLTIAVMRPIIVVKQWKQSAVFSKLILIFLSEMVFYWALSNADLEMERKALKFAMYMIISLILTISRRVMPFFIERGVGYPVTLRNSKAIDVTSLVLIVTLSIIDVFFNLPELVSVVAFLLVVVHAIRLSGWYTSGIWTKPLLWILFIGYLFLILGFFFKIFTFYTHHFNDAALHAFTAGGIGLYTLGMMARVAWGHTGRNISEAPKILPVIFYMIVASAVLRVLLTLVDASRYGLWIGISQILWAGAFALYVICYFRVLTSVRADGNWG
jgi:uncharacterized protein involved in response to NO